MNIANLDLFFNYKKKTLTHRTPACLYTLVVENTADTRYFIQKKM